MVSQGTQADADKHLPMSGFQVHPCQPDREKSKGNYKGGFLMGQGYLYHFHMCPVWKSGKCCPFTEYIVPLNKDGFCYKNKIERRANCFC